MKTLRIEYSRDEADKPHRITRRLYKLTADGWQKILIGEFKDLMEEQGEQAVEVISPDDIPRLKFVPTDLFHVH